MTSRSFRAIPVGTTLLCLRSALPTFRPKDGPSSNLQILRPCERFNLKGSSADPTVRRRRPYQRASRRVRGSEYPIISTAKCASLADGTIVGEFSEVGKCSGYHQVFR